MKKIVLILIAVVMLFAACENRTENAPDSTAEISVNTATTQIDPAEEFGGITFGMTQEEVISFHEKEPDFIYEPDSNSFDYNYISYDAEEYFNVIADAVTYCFKREDGALRRMVIDYSYNESDYKVIKEELIRRYPEEICTYFSNDETDLTIYTENRSIFFHASNSHISIFVDEYIPGIYDTRSDAEEENEPAEETFQPQIDPAEEFGGITFGMTQDEVIEFHGREPLFTFDNKAITYRDETYFNISDSQTDYYFDENGKLYSIDIIFSYEDIEDSSFQSD